MTRLFFSSAILLILAVSFVLSNHQAYATPVSYNITSLAVPFTTYTRANFDVLVEAGYNGTITSGYQGRISNGTLNWEFGYHPTLPLTLDTKNNITASASIAPTQTISLTVGSNLNNKMVLVGITFQHNGDVNHNNAKMTSVTIGGQSMTLALNRTITCGVNTCSSQIWYLGNSTLSGAQTVTITPSSVTTYHMVAGAYSLYNVRNISPVGVTNSTTTTSAKPTVALTPTFKGSSWLVDNLFSQQTTSPSTNATQKWVGKTSVLMGASQIVTNPTISSGNSLSYTTTNVQWAETAVEIIPIQNQLNFGFNLARESASLTNVLNMPSNGSKIYYFGATGTGIILQHIDTITGVETHDWTMFSPATNCALGNNPTLAILPAQARVITYCAGGAFGSKTISTGNTTSAVASTITFASDEKIKTTGSIANGDKFNSNATGFNSDTITSNQCELTYIPTNATTVIDNIACDDTIPTHAYRFWNGMFIYKIGNYYMNATNSFTAFTDSQTYKKFLTIPASIYNIPNPDVKLLGRWGGADYLLSVSSGQINYATMSSITTAVGSNRAYQSYLLTLVNTDSHDYLSPSSVSPQVSIKLYGPSLNVTVSKFGLLTLPSGYTMKTSSSESLVRALDPRWTNAPQNDIPAISTTGTQFPIVLTVANAPTDGALWLVNSGQVIQNQNSAWCITQLDSTHTAECDVPPSQCPEVFVADSSVAPTVYIDQGSVCATGTNTKTIAYTNTLPITFYQLKYSATHSYTPSTNGLSVTTRSSTAPYTYTVIIKNNTGSITQNFTTTINGTIDTHVFNVTNSSKPSSLFVYAGGTQIYSAYLGSSVSLASVASFFHTYLSYQGFDLISFVPILFASMFTRNTVGIGVILVVLCVATLNFLSVSIIPDAYVIIMAIVACVGLVGYRGIYG